MSQRARSRIAVTNGAARTGISRDGVGRVKHQVASTRSFRDNGERRVRWRFRDLAFSSVWLEWRAMGNLILVTQSPLPSDA